MDAISPAGAVPAIPSRAQNTAREFEAVFLGQMTKLMMESIEPGDFSGGHCEEMFRSLLAEDLGREMAKGRGIGLSDKVMAEIVRLQSEGGAK